MRESRLESVALDRLLAPALDKPAQALAEARALLAHGPPPLVAAVAHQTAGIVLRDFGAMAEALADLRAALRQARAAGDPRREADVLSTLGAALVMAGDTRRGLAALAAATDGFPGDPDARLLVRRAHVCWLLGRHREALAEADLTHGAADHSRRPAGRPALGTGERADRSGGRRTGAPADRRPCAGPGPSASWRIGQCLTV